jgi:hypothetical protein
MPSIEVERVSQPRGDRVLRRQQGAKRSVSSSPDEEAPLGAAPHG